MQYRVYLVGPGNRIQAGESLIAENDLEASEVATALYRCCSATFQSAELWRGTEVVMRLVPSDVRNRNVLRQLADKRQESVAQLEEVLERSFACVRESRELMDSLDRFRGR